MEKELRHSEYYDLQDCFDKLYAKIKQGDAFTNLMEIISSEENIRLAYRNIKRNSGGHTRGVDSIPENVGYDLFADKYVCGWDIRCGCAPADTYEFRIVSADVSNLSAE